MSTPARDLWYLDFVDLLLDEELGQREGRRFRNALKLSGMPHHKTLDEFDFAFQPDLDVRKVRDWPPWSSSKFLLCRFSGPTANDTG